MMRARSAPALATRLTSRGGQAVNRLRLRALRLALRLRPSASDPAALLDTLPEASLMPLRRVGLDPVPELTQRRYDAPVSRLEMPFGLRGWLVTGDAECRRVLAGGSDEVSTDFGTVVGAAGMSSDNDPGGLGMADPPTHTRLRQLLTPHFTKRAVEQRSAQISVVIDDALDDLENASAAGEPVDLHRHFALRVPSEVVMDLLGIPSERRHDFHDLSTRRFDLSGGAGTSLDTIQQALDLLLEIVAEQRVTPGPGLIGSLTRDGACEISDRELAGLADGVVTGGLETTASMLSLGTLVLLRDPALRRRVREEPASVAPYVEEILRYLTVVQVGFPRFVRRDLQVGGHTLLAGDIAVCSLSAANRDPRRSPEHGAATPSLETVDPDRLPSATHLAFGHGIHRCVGAELARLELRLAYPALLRRFPDLRLAVDEGDLSYRERSVVYGVDALPVVLS